MSDFEVMPAGSGRVLQEALQQLERGFAGRNHPEHKLGLVGAARQALGALEEATNYVGCEAWSPSMTEECIGAATALRAALVQQEQAPVAWRFRTLGIEHAAWRLTDDVGLIAQMRKLGHWDIRPLGELPAEGGGK